MYKKFIFLLLFFLIPQNLYSKEKNLIPVYENITGFNFKKAKEYIYDYFLIKEANILESIDEDKAIEVYQSIIDNYPNTPNYKKAFRRIIEIKLRNKANDLTYYFEKYISRFSNDYDLIYKIAAYLLNNNQQEKGLNLLKNLFNTADVYSVKALKKLIEFKVNISDKEKLNVIKKLYEKKLFDEIVELENVSSFVGKEEKVYLVKSLFKTRKYKIVADLTKDERDWTLREFYLLSILRMGDRDGFLKEVEYLFQKKEKSIFDLYLLYVDIKKMDEKYDEAFKILTLLKEYFPEKKEIILWKEALMLIGLNDFRNAEIRLLELSDNFPQDRYFFWLGKVNEYQGKDGSRYFDMIKNEEDYYYIRVKKPINKEKKSYLSKKLDRVDALILLKMIDDAVEELLYHLNKNGNDEANLIDYFKQLKLYNQTLKLGLRLNDIYLKYPLAYDEIVFKTAERFNIDAFLVLAVMREESHFRKNVVSTANAYGLMQIIPPTARKFDKNISEKDLFKEEKNIEIGIKYLSFLLKRFKNVEEAVSAYNAGEINVDKWLSNKYKDVDEFIENIPFNETRSYVKKVMRSYYIYKSLYEK